MEPKSYIIVDEHNRWLATGKAETSEEMESAMSEVKKRLEQDGEKGTICYFYEVVSKPVTFVAGLQ